MIEDERDHLPSEKRVRDAVDEVERSARAARWFGLGLLSIGVLSMIAMSAATVYIGLGVRDLLEDRAAVARREAADAERQTFVVGNVMNCLLGQFYEHRLATRKHIVASGAVLENHEPIVFDPGQTKAACDATTQGLRDLRGGPPRAGAPPG